MVPGANDNLSSVGVLIALAARLRERPIEGLRVLLVSTGSEESFSEGMQAFGERHFSELDRAAHRGAVPRGARRPDADRARGRGDAEDARLPGADARRAGRGGVGGGRPITRGIRTVAATDAIIALRAGYPTVTLASVAETKLPLNYHWPSDVPDELHWETIEDAIEVCDAFVRLRSRGGAQLQATCGAGVPLEGAPTPSVGSP